MGYGLKVTGTDTNGEYVVSDTDENFKPLIVANVGSGTSVDVPASGNYLIYANQKGLYGTLSGGASTQTATRVTVSNNVAYFWYCSNWSSSQTGMGTNTISATWSNTANCRYIILAESDALTASGNDYGLIINDSAGDDILDTRKITINDSFRIRGQFTYDSPFTDNEIYASYTVDSDEDMFVEMAPFTEDTSGTPDTRFVVGPEFNSTEVSYGVNTASQGYGKYYGSFSFGKLLYNPTNITTGKPAGWTQPY